MPTNKPRFSVVIAACDNARELDSHLPAYLHQEYEPGYEVIVVDESSADDTDEVLKLLKGSSPTPLYNTFLPKPDPNMSRPRMALTLGVKAAKNERIAFASIHTPPPSPTWLAELAEYAGESTLILGYVNRKNGNVRLQLFESIDQAAPIVSKAERRFAHGHRGKLLRYLCGKYDFIVVPTSQGHDVLRLFEHDIRGSQLLWLRLRVVLYNMFH